MCICAWTDAQLRLLDDIHTKSLHFDLKDTRHACAACLCVVAGFVAVYGRAWVCVLVCMCARMLGSCFACCLDLRCVLAHVHLSCSEVQHAIDRGLQFVRDQQRDDGSWYGSWAVCFTYGCWFGVEAIVAAGDPRGKDAMALAKVCSFLLSKQRADGGWGESYLSCLTKQYNQDESTAVHTAWALLALTHAQCTDAFSVRRGIDFLISRQSVNGDWLQENLSGIFNRTCGITYTAYRNVFPLWALAAFQNSYEHRIDAPLALSFKDPLHAVAGAVISPEPTGPLAAAHTSEDAALPTPTRVRRRSMVKK
ncbi:MAG: hypothetical protein EOO65_04635 [Methanosarcinales archaeon]|nr:MAG: hypothetical protein EOO65_04635 [Methanosarcinales archaeon]